MSLDYIVKGDYGQTIELTVIDGDTGSAADLSAYTTSQAIILRDPSGNEASKAAEFKTDGEDGIVDYTIEEDVIDEAGQWSVRAQVASDSARLSSIWADMLVID